ncbi:hypothetical protein MYCTH_2304763 [Thermothelomyces thermophilus ATCC 42464]|uniref:Transcription factor SipA3 n=1 Tax=Thermothelomyces thermophilus (strain ATCC 42464 / BCRC 31852 / DSM 1799) TaxID=573729 RepID=G2QBJ7_THET4|nr:uncharacterized protein MYCTH_2304763 [Thermothelomyces thermophilus ATCC 42464]AEO57940.1 hypothetical protein MYCTH_2304763 [Thermothelomyces thermophilus ATCC 42464]
MNEPTIPPAAALAGLRPSAPMPPTTTATTATATTTTFSSGPSRQWSHPPSSQPSEAPPRPSHSGPAIPVMLNEAALDSPTFRATAVHFSDQLDAIERWLDSYARSTSKLVHDVLALEDTVGAYLSKISPPAIASPADSPVLDADYTLPALRRAGDAARDWWGGVLAVVRRLEPAGVEPIRAFVQGDLRNFREARRALDAAQKTFDATIARYAAQSKTKEPSALREDAFAVFETRRAYLKASLDYCQLAPQVRAGLDKLLVRICADVGREMRRTSAGGGGGGASSGSGRPQQVPWWDELERIRGWAREMDMAEGVFRRELQIARRDIGESTLALYKPSRELEDYSVSTVPFLGSKGPMSMQRKDGAAVISEKQGWLFLRVLSGKPVRTTWVRRWYYCRDGIFGWLVQGPQGVLQGDEIGVLLCSARPAVQEERRFCFEIKTKTQTIMLQAETQAQLIEWLEVFEVAKKKAIEASMGRDQSSSRVGGADPVFSVTPPSIPDFSAKTLDNIDEPPTVDRQSSLPVPGQDGGLARASFDAPPRRSITTHLGREDGESGREHAARIIQKLDLHRKSAFTSWADTSTSGPAGGSLNPSAAPSPQIGHAPPLRVPSSVAPDYTPGSLAPVTLAKPPVTTNLSKTAILASANAGASRGLPSAALANYWGSSPYTSTMYCVSPSLPHTPKPDMSDPFVATATTTPRAPAVEKPSASASSHRKTVSVDATITDAKARKEAPSDTFPPNYPPELRAQYAQFRLFFPAAPVNDKPVLVFNAAWSSTSSDGKEAGMAGNGRIFVTPDRMYFYGHQLGLVVAYAIHLDCIAELTSAPGRDCDFVFLHLNQDMPDIAYSRITIKVFLEDFSLLQSRLDLLVDNLQAAEPMDLSELIAALSALNREQDDRRSPSVESWEEVSSNTPADDGTPFGRPVSRRAHDSHGRYRSSRGLLKKSSVQKVQLPTQPVVYEPEDMGKSVAERHFEISAKSCFHVLFGDKSFIFPKLYFGRGAKEMAQGPWELQDHGRMRRQFRFKVEYADVLGRKRPGDVVDTQTIDVFNDHITYVVTHVKTPWHLPHSHAFKLVTKVVITHLAKSKCKLAIYTKVDWSKAPPFSKNMVQRQALDDAANDAEELADAATDQVRKLGPHSRTKRAIQVYGDIGQQQQVVVFQPDATPEGQQLLLKSGGAAVRPRTLTDMMLETGRSFMESAITSVMMWAFAGLRSIFKMVSANRWILLLLATSAAYNLMVISQSGAAWWVERRSARYMNRLGVGPNLMMSKAIYLADLDEAAGRTALHRPEDSGRSQCYDTFQSLLNATISLDAPYQSAGPLSGFGSTTNQVTARRLRRVRQRMGAYRHDLLVAMRVVNKIELEMVQSEWESWLAGETRRCEQVKDLLGRWEDGGHSGSGKEERVKGQVPAQSLLSGAQTWESASDGDDATGGSGEKQQQRRLAALRAWFSEYCTSCALEERKISERMETPF